MSDETKTTKTTKAEPRPAVLILTVSPEQEADIRAAADAAGIPAAEFLYALHALQQRTGICPLG